MNKDRFMKEVEGFLNNNKNLNREDFEILFKFVNDIKGNNSRVVFCDELIKKMFGAAYQEPLIPWNFFDTEIGKAIIKIKYGQSSDVFFVREIAETVGKSRQYINQEIQLGNLRAYKRCGNSVVYRGDLEDYLKKRGIDEKVLYKETDEKMIIPSKEREEKYGK
jgi:hypothetical protein